MVAWSGADEGGAIYQIGCTLNVNNCLIEDNENGFQNEWGNVGAVGWVSDPDLILPAMLRHGCVCA